MGKTNDTARLVWLQDNQIPDDSSVTLVYFNHPTGTFLDLNDHSDTIGSLTLPAGTLVKTGTTTGGVLTVGTLIVDGETMLPGTYTEATHPAFVSGLGSVVVPSSGTPFELWAATNAGGQSASEDYDGDGVPNGVEFFIGATGSSFTANPTVANGKVSWPHVGQVASFEVQVSDNLADWLPADPADVDTTTDPGVVTYTLPTGAAKKFCRLMVVP